MKLVNVKNLIEENKNLKETIVHLKDEDKNIKEEIRNLGRQVMKSSTMSYFTAAAVTRYSTTGTPIPFSNLITEKN